MMYASTRIVEFRPEETTNTLMAEFTTLGQRLFREMAKRHDTEFAKDLFDTAHDLILEEANNGGK